MKVGIVGADMVGSAAANALQPTPGERGLAPLLLFRNIPA